MEQPFLGAQRADDPSKRPSTGLRARWVRPACLLLLVALAAVFASLFAWQTARLAAYERTHPASPAPPAAISQMPADIRARILSTMDGQVDPCADFFRYSCGAWLDANPLPANATDDIELAWDPLIKTNAARLQQVLDDNFTQAGQYYRSCLNGSVTLRSDPRWSTSFEVTAYWLSRVDELFDLGALDLSHLWQLLGELHSANMGGSTLLLSFAQASKYAHFPSASEMASELAQEDVLLLSNHNFLQYTFGAYNSSVLADALWRTHAEFAASGLPDVFESGLHMSAAHHVREWLDWLLQREATLQRRQTRNYTPQLANFTVMDTWGFDSQAYKQGLGNHSWPFLRAHMKVEQASRYTGYADHLTNLRVSDVSFTNYMLSSVRELVFNCSHLQRESECAELARIKSSFKVEVVAAHWPALPEEFSNGLQTDTTNPASRFVPDRAAYCSHSVSDSFNNVFQSETFAETMAPGVTLYITDMSRRLRSTLGDLLLEATWIDQATRTRALNKWELMTQNVFYDNSWEHPRYGLVVTDNFALNLLAGSSYKVQRILASLSVPRDLRSPESRDLAPFDMTTYYAPEVNSINLLPGMATFPLFDMRLPSMLNIASYGLAVGHEMVHGFDNNGRRYDALGDLNDWWTPESSTAFDARAQCLIDQYDNIRLFNVSLDGSGELGENIADNGGMRMAWRLFQQEAAGVEPLLAGTGITNDQLFFLWYGQIWCQSSNANTVSDEIIRGPHAPGGSRGWAPAQNMPEFAHAFQCAPESFMGKSLRPDRCLVW